MKPTRPEDDPVAWLRQCEEAKTNIALLVFIEYFDKVKFDHDFARTSHNEALAGESDDDIEYWRHASRVHDQRLYALFLLARKIVKQLTKPKLIQKA